MASFVIEDRVLGGIRFVDIATEAAIRIPLDVRAVPSGRRVRSYPNRRGVHVIAAAEGFEDYVVTFDPVPTLPPVGSVTVDMEVRDPSGTYLPRQFSVDLPRVVNPAAADSVFEPVTVSLLRSPTASRSRNWAMVRIRLQQGATTIPVTSALLRVVHDPAGAREILGYGMSVLPDPEARVIEQRLAGGPRWVHFEARHVGEASVPVVGLNTQIWAVDPGEDVVLTNIAATLEVLPMPLAGAGRLPDPDDFLEAAVAPGNSRNITLSVGGEIHEQPFSVTL